MGGEGGVRFLGGEEGGGIQRGLGGWGGGKEGKGDVSQSVHHHTKNHHTTFRSTCVRTEIAFICLFVFVLDAEEEGKQPRSFPGRVPPLLPHWTNREDKAGKGGALPPLGRAGGRRRSATGDHTPRKGG